MSSLTLKVKDWPKFIKNIKMLADKEDICLIEMKKLEGILNEEGIVFNEKEKELIF